MKPFKSFLVLCSLVYSFPFPLEAASNSDIAEYDQEYEQVSAIPQFFQEPDDETFQNWANENGVSVGGESSYDESAFDESAYDESEPEAFQDPSPADGTELYQAEGKNYDQDPGLMNDGAFESQMQEGQPDEEFDESDDQQYASDTAGERVAVAQAAAPSASPVAPSTAKKQGNPALFFGVIGGFILLIAIGSIVYHRIKVKRMQNLDEESSLIQLGDKPLVK
ncbi:hypothetical protein HDV03_004051 [Kappamyces sp. JEL0829]|nr:hypothetical protein HDV03_004051 [Kappamyces sp. JEL0829]